MTMDMRIIDTNARYFGLPPRILMENAGRGIADYVRTNFDAGKVAVVCGSGNNGGDGFVIARHLSEHADVHVIIVQDPERIRSHEARENYELLSASNVRVTASPTPTLHWDYDLIIDAMLGTGVSGSVREPYASYIAMINRLDVPVVSVDLPSGHGTDLPIKSDCTISLHQAKVDGAVVLPLGIPSPLSHRCGPGNVKFLHRRHKLAHKRQGGVVAVVGGSNTYHGAPAYASLTAASICDLVYVLCPERVGDALRSMSPDLIIESQHAPTITRPLVDSPTLSAVNCILCGVGAGRTHDTIEALQHLYECATVPLVVDADGIYALKGRLDLLDETVCITPHVKEFEQLFGQLPEEVDKRARSVERVAKRYGCTIVLKGATDIISNGTETWHNVTGNEGMTTGGTGDVLAGCIAAFAATNPLFESALGAAFAVGRAGDVVHANMETYFTASDVIDALPGVLAFCRKY